METGWRVAQVRWRDLVHDNRHAHHHKRAEAVG